MYVCGAQVGRHRDVGVMSNLLDVVKTQHDSLWVDLAPCGSIFTKLFANNKFNASPELLQQPRLYSKSELVQTTVNARLTWEATGTWNKEQYLKAMKKWFPGESPKLLNVEDGKNDKEPSTDYKPPSTRCRTSGDDAAADVDEPAAKRVTRVTNNNKK